MTARRKRWQPLDVAVPAISRGEPMWSTRWCCCQRTVSMNGALVRRANPSWPYWQLNLIKTKTRKQNDFSPTKPVQLGIYIYLFLFSCWTRRKWHSPNCYSLWTISSLGCVLLGFHWRGFSFSCWNQSSHWTFWLDRCVLLWWQTNEVHRQAPSD